MSVTNASSVMCLLQEESFERTVVRSEEFLMLYMAELWPRELFFDSEPVPVRDHYTLNYGSPHFTVTASYLVACSPRFCSCTPASLEVVSDFSCIGLRAVRSCVQNCSQYANLKQLVMQRTMSFTEYPAGSPETYIGLSSYSPDHLQYIHSGLTTNFGTTEN